MPTIVWVAPSGGRAASAGTFITLAGQPRVHGAGNEHRRSVAGRSGGEDLTGTIGDEGQERRDRQHPVDRRDSRSERRLGGLDRRQGGVVVGQSRPSRSAPSMASPRRSRMSATRRTARRSRSTVEDGDGGADRRPVRRRRHEPVPVDHPPAVRSEYRVHPADARFLRSAVRAPEPELRDRRSSARSRSSWPSSASAACRSTSAGLLLIGLAVLLFVLEFTVTSHGLLAVGGLVCFVLGAFTLYTAPGSPTAPDVTVAAPLVVLMAIARRVHAGRRVRIVRVRRRSLAYAHVYGAGGSSIVPAGSEGIVRLRSRRSASSTPLARSGRHARAAARILPVRRSASSDRRGLPSSSNPDGNRAGHRGERIVTSDQVCLQRS